MNPATLQPVIHQAQRNQAANRTWRLLRPSLVIELVEAAVRLEDAERRLAQVAQLADEANIALPDHHLGVVREKLDAILHLTNFVGCDRIESV
jgi:hypothetical protein